MSERQRPSRLTLGIRIVVAVFAVVLIVNGLRDAFHVGQRSRAAAPAPAARAP